MNLTASALSHQLQVLENQLGIQLFVRTGRGLSFTQIGKQLHAEVDTCLKQLSLAISSATTRDENSVLVVNSFPTFAMRWLLPRFASFEKRYESVEIRVSALSIDFERDNVDCAIYYGHETRRGVVSELLTDVSLIVVCAPSTITEARPLTTPADLSHHQLLRTKAKFEGQKIEEWQTWFDAAEVAPPANLRELVLENRNLVIQAAKSGLGVAVVDPMMIKDELASGALIQPLPQVAKAKGAYYLAYAAGVPPSEKIIAFREWLLNELRESRNV